MARVHQIVLTLTGAAQQLGASDSSTEFGIGEISIQPRGTNSGAVYIGTSSSVSSSNYSVRLPAAAAGVPPAPFILGGSDDGSIKIGDFWVLGTNTEHLHILITRVKNF